MEIFIISISVPGFQKCSMRQGIIMLSNSELLLLNKTSGKINVITQCEKKKKEHRDSEMREQINKNCNKYVYNYISKTILNFIINTIGSCIRCLQLC